MSDILHLVSPVLAVMLLLAAAGSAGEMLLSRLCLDVNSKAERAAVSMTLGLATLAALLFLLGLAGYFTRAAMLAIQVGAIAAWLFTRRASPASIGSHPSWLLLFLALAPLFVLALYPTVEWDSLQYHLPLIKAHLQSGHIQPVLHLRFPVFPQLVEILFAIPMALSNELAAQMLNVGFILLTCLWLFAFGKRHDHELTGWWSAAMYLSFPIVVWFAGTADIDAGLTLFTAAALFSVLSWQSSGNADWLTVAGLSAGSMAAAKYTGAPILCGLAILVLILGKRRDLPRFLFPAVAAAAPCYIYIAWRTGDPVWPAAQNVFGYWSWTPDDVVAQGKDLSQFGIGHGLRSILMLPWNLAFHTDLFDAIEDRAWTFLLLALAPLGLFARHRVTRLASLLFLAGVAGWFFSAQVLRYLVPLLPLGCFLAALALRTVAPRGFETPVARILVCVVLMFTGTRYAATTLAHSGPVPVSAPTREAWLQKSFGNYEVARFMNRRAGTNYTMYAIYGQNLNAWVDGNILGEVCGPWRYSRISDKLYGDEPALVRELRAMGVDYLMVCVKGLGYDAIRNWPAWKQLRPVFGSGVNAIFQLAPPPAAVTPDVYPVDRTLERKDIIRRVVPVMSEQLYAFTVCVQPQEKTAHLAVRVDWLGKNFQRLEKSGLDFPILGSFTNAPFFLTAPPGAEKARIELSRDKKVPIGVERILVRRLATDG